MFRSVPGTGGVRRVWRRPATLEALGYLPSPDRQRDPGCHRGSGETYTAALQNAAPVLDAAFCVLLVADANPSRARAPGPDEQAEVGGVDDAIAIDVETLAA